MEKGEIKCCLCGIEANQEEGYDTSRNVRVSCQRCGKYELTNMAIRFYLRRDNGEELLHKEDKEKLSEYVKKRYDSATGLAVLIDSRTIEAVTGKRSVNER